MKRKTPLGRMAALNRKVCSWPKCNKKANAVAADEDGELAKYCTEHAILVAGKDCLGVIQCVMCGCYQGRWR